MHALKPEGRPQCAENARSLHSGWLAGALLLFMLGGSAIRAQSASAQNNSARQKFTQAVAEGTRALQTGHNQNAEKAYRQALALDPHSVEVLNNLALSHRAPGT